eukprot:jgi/Picre1/30104/NNA_005473.t1
MRENRSTGGTKGNIRKLSLCLLLALLFMFVEIFGGIWAGSLAIITDAAHLLADVSGFGVSLMAMWYSARQSKSHSYSYGYARIETLAALASVLTVWLVTGILVWEAIQRIQHPTPVNSFMMVILASIGIVINIVLMVVLGGHGHGHDGHHHHDHGHDLNLRGAIIHVIGDLIQSVGVFVGGLLMWWHRDSTAWLIVDPICTLLFACIVLWSTSSLIRDIGDILMERSPRGVDGAMIQRELQNIEGVSRVNDFHVWSLTPTVPLLAAHLHIEDVYEQPRVLYEAKQVSSQHGIDHSTFEISIDCMKSIFCCKHICDAHSRWHECSLSFMQGA